MRYHASTGIIRGCRRWSVRICGARYLTNKCTMFMNGQRLIELPPAAAASTASAHPNPRADDARTRRSGAGEAAARRHVHAVGTKLYGITLLDAVNAVAQRSCASRVHVVGEALGWATERTHEAYGADDEIVQPDYGSEDGYADRDEGRGMPELLVLRAGWVVRVQGVRMRVECHDDELCDMRDAGAANS